MPMSVYGLQDMDCQTRVFIACFLSYATACAYFFSNEISPMKLIFFSSNIVCFTNVCLFFNTSLLVFSLK